MQYKDIEKIVRLIEESGFDEFEWQNKTEKLRLKRTPSAPAGATMAYSAAPMYAAGMAPAAPQASAPATEAKAASAPVNTNLKQITSPFVGTYYEAPAPDAPKYTDIGRGFKKGDVLCIVEAMKIMNEIESEFSGKVVSILVKNGAPVQYGQPLFEVEAQ